MQSHIYIVGHLHSRKSREAYLGKPSEAGFSVRGKCWVLCKTCPHLHTHSIQDETTFVELGRLCSVTQMLHAKYHAAKSFCGTKIQRILWFCGYLQKFSLQNLVSTVTNPRMSSPQKSFFHQFVKVVSHESFPLYGNM